MTRSKKIFTGIMVLFFAGLVGLVIDISRKTTFPGAKKRSQEVNQFANPAKPDTAKNTLSPKSTPHQP